MHILLQSLPLGPSRRSVGIYYKELADQMDYLSPADIARDWDGVKRITELPSAYSTMVWQADNRLGFLYEEETHCTSNYAYGGYTIVYDCLTVEELTDGEYSYSK